MMSLPAVTLRSGSSSSLKVCSVTFDDALVIRDLKLIEADSRFFVAMPSRKLTDRFPRCNHKNVLQSRYCSHCGVWLDEYRAFQGDERPKLYADIAHPINTMGREVIEAAETAQYWSELERSQLPGYVCSYGDLEGELPWEEVAEHAPESTTVPLQKKPRRLRIGMVRPA